MKKKYYMYFLTWKNFNRKTPAFLQNPRVNRTKKLG